MQLHISPSLHHVTVFPGKGVKDFIKVKVGSRRASYRMIFCSLLFITFLLRFLFVSTAPDTIDGESNCSTFGCVERRIWGRRPESMKVPEEIYRILEENREVEDINGGSEVPQSLEEFIAEMKTFALKLKAMVRTIFDKF